MGEGEDMTGSSRARWTTEWMQVEQKRGGWWREFEPSRWETGCQSDTYCIAERVCSDGVWSWKADR